MINIILVVVVAVARALDNHKSLSMMITKW